MESKPSRTASSDVVLAAVGDLALHGLYDRHAAEGRADRVLADASRAFEGVDVVFGNMECVLAQGGMPQPGKLCLRGNPVYAGVLRAAGFDVVSVANNHSLDFGPEGLEGMDQALRLAGIYSVGAGKNRIEAGRPVKLTRNGLRFTFLAYSDAGTGGLNGAGPETPGVAPYEVEGVLTDIDRCRPEADVLVVSVHWGEEHCPYPSPDQVAEARRMIDAGATLVLGHHSHMFQGIERYRRGLIAYSLGNFLASDIRWKGPLRDYAYDLREIDREGIVLRCALSREGVKSFDVLPVRIQEDGRVAPCDGKQADMIRVHLAERSAPLLNGGYEEFWQGFRLEQGVYGPLKKWWKNGSLLDKARRLRVQDVRRAAAMARKVLGRRTRPERA